MIPMRKQRENNITKGWKYMKGEKFRDYSWNISRIKSTTNIYKSGNGEFLVIEGVININNKCRKAFHNAHSFPKNKEIRR